MIHGSKSLKPPENIPRAKNVGRRSGPMRIPQIPMEWMDPSGWRLPSGKLLAEFALQSGFLAPLMLNTPRYRRTPKPQAKPEPAISKRDLEETHKGR
jgi:hypothetical protein